MKDDRKAWDELVSKEDLLEKVAGDLGLIEKGKHFYCPGCQPAAEGTPEMAIKKGSFRCFRCGAQGDVVGLVKLARRCSLEEAIAWLAREAGTDSPL